MRSISYKHIVDKTAELCIKSNIYLREDLKNRLNYAYNKEESQTGKYIISKLLENAKIAKEKGSPLCQDTGIASVFVEIGQDVSITGGLLKNAIEEGVKKGYDEGYLRKSMCHPLTRENTGDNTPPIINYEIVKGDKLKILLAPKGGGSENMSSLKMLKPSDGVEGIIKFVLKTIEDSGPNPCPPIIVGIGIGGSFEKCALLAKKSLYRSIGVRNKNKEIADLEEVIFNKINNLGIGPQGFGGTVTCLSVNIEMEHCHIACLPVAVNINCHAARYSVAIL